MLKGDDASLQNFITFNASLPSRETDYYWSNENVSLLSSLSWSPKAPQKMTAWRHLHHGPPPPTTEGREGGVIHLSLVWHLLFSARGVCPQPADLFVFVTVAGASLSLRGRSTLSIELPSSFTVGIHSFTAASMLLGYLTSPGFFSLLCLKKKQKTTV